MAKNPLLLHSIMGSLGFFIAFFMMLFLTPFFVRWLSRWVVQSSRVAHHEKKRWTPAMGGILMMASIVVASLICANVRNPYVCIALGGMVLFGALGAWDDVMKLREKTPQGISAKAKLVAQVFIALIIMALLGLFWPTPLGSQVWIPGLGAWMHVGAGGVMLLGALVLTGTTNGVNLTDGLDALAIRPIVISAGVLGVLSFAIGQGALRSVLNFPQVADFFVLSGIVMGAGVGFLWYNAHPARLFMGDSGSMSLGALLAIMAVSMRQEALFFLLGGVFVVETLSVILQVWWFRRTKGRRLFLMSPLHHHFEKKGVGENHISVRFGIIALILALVTLLLFCWDARL